MEDPVADAILNQYFRRLEQALSGLAAERRAHIVEDVRAHVEECLQAESDHSDATVLAILDRVGDPDEIAREALADDAMPGAVGATAASVSAATRLAPSALLRRWRLTASGLVLIIAAVVAVIFLTSGRSPASATKSSGPTVPGRLVADTDPSGSASGGWLPASDVSGDHQSPGGSDCAPQTTSGSGSASALEAGATKVASGSVGGHAWSVWSKNGQRGANGLETGGVVVDGAAHGLCPGFPNPGEMELLEPSGGGDGIAYGVVGYPGMARVAIYRDTFGNFATTKLEALTTAQKVNGVGFFITSLSQSACDVPGVEMNTASSRYATEHNLAFATSDCKNGQLVPISNSQGIWALPPSGFPNKFQPANGGGRLVGGGPPSRTGPDFSSCSPMTDAATSGQAAASIPGASQVATGTIDGQSWSLWSKQGQKGSAALEDAGVILDGHAYGICPGAPNPAEFELIDPPSGGNGIVIGVSGYDGAADVKLSVGTPRSFAAGTLLYSGHTVSADGTGFFIAQLPKSACDYSWLELNVKARRGASQHLLGFDSCTTGKLARITGGQGAWGQTRPLGNGK
jgi:hypothetical protein